MNRYLMALDAGIGGGRCVITDTAGNEVARTYEEWHYNYLPDIPDAVEFDAGEFWAIMCRLIRRALNESKLAPADIAGVSATCMREGFLLLDAAGEALYAAPPFDGRAREQNARLAETRGQEIYEVTGQWPSYLFGIGRLLWFREKTPELWQRAKHLLQINEWLLWRLCGERTGEPSNGSALALVDVRRRDWAWELIDSLDLPRDLFPPMRDAGQPLGRVTGGAAEETGLQAGTPVIVGGADSQCGLIGAGTVRHGEIGAILGTTTPIILATAAPVFDPEARTWTRCHTVPDAWCLESNAGATGILYRWLRDTICELERAAQDRIGVNAYELMNHRAASVPPGSRGVTVVGPALMHARYLERELVPATVFGLDAMRPELAGKSELIRAVLESVCYAVRANCEVLSDVSGLKLEALRVGGGQTRSKLWMQMQADILGIPVLVSRFEEATAIGAIVCAAVGSGVYGSFGEAVDQLLAFTAIDPQPAVQREYEPFYRHWRTLWDWRVRLCDELLQGEPE